MKKKKMFSVAVLSFKLITHLFIWVIYNIFTRLVCIIMRSVIFLINKVIIMYLYKSVGNYFLVSQAWYENFTWMNVSYTCGMNHPLYSN